MKKADSALLRRIEDLIHKTMALAERAPDAHAADETAYAMKGLIALADAVLQGRPVFGIEPWHPLHESVSSRAPGEMLLRLKDPQGAKLAPYPLIMAFYKNGLSVEIDGVLFLCALRQFTDGAEQQVSINMSARSLRDADFIKTILGRMEQSAMPEHKKIIIEIHESTPHLKMSEKLLKMLRRAGLEFAIDDVGLSMNDVLRLSDFENIADYIKLDRQSVHAEAENPGALSRVVSFISATLPQATIVAEGVKSAAHARELQDSHPAIQYVQGLHLPDRTRFAQEWAGLSLEKA